MNTLIINTPSSNTLPAQVSLPPSPKDDDDNNEEVYLVMVGVDDLCGDHQHLQKFKTIEENGGFWKTTYYQTYGGGPEGGYFVRNYYVQRTEKIGRKTRTYLVKKRAPQYYEVERSWGKPFSVKAMDGILVDFQRDEKLFVSWIPSLELTRTPF